VLGEADRLEHPVAVVGLELEGEAVREVDSR
jgi:hypothetical protein